MDLKHDARMNKKNSNLKKVFYTVNDNESCIKGDEKNKNKILWADRKYEVQ